MTNKEILLALEICESKLKENERWRNQFFIQAKREATTFNKELLTIEETCILLGINRKTIYKKINNKRFNAIKKNNKWLVYSNSI